MRYAKRGSRVCTGNMNIPNDLIQEYIGTLCFMVSDFQKGKEEFVDISMTRQQLQDLKEVIDHYLTYTAKYPPFKERPGFLKD